jgi:hypothetical protein
MPAAYLLFVIAFIRICRMVLGYAFAIMVSAIAAAIYVWITGGSFAEFVEDYNKIGLGLREETPVGFVLYFASVFGFFAALPALFVIVIGELRNFKNVFYYAFSSAVIGYIILLISPDKHHQFLGVTSGCLAGVAYWLIAGRYVGSWKRWLG